MIKFPYIFTFYSYKGGVGRSMALLNTAYTLAGRGRHVLILDLDLEAPGLSDFLSRNEEMDGPGTESPGDIIDLLIQVKDSATNRTPPKQAISKIDVIERFRRSAKSSKVKPPRIGPPGRLDVIPAMMQDFEGESYWQRLAALDLRTTSKDDLQRMGLILARYLQQQLLVVHSPGLDELGCTESVPYDYILVDSRTGITELGGLCVGPLCDRLVVCTALNDQNVNGTRSFLQEAGIKLNVRGADDFQPWDEADPKPVEEIIPQTIGPKPTLIVATPVPYGEIEYKRKRIKELQDILGPVSAKLSYHPQMALFESVFVRDFPEEYLAAEYRNLADRMMASVSDHYVQLTRRSLDAWNERKDPQEAVNVGIRLASHDFAAGISFLLQLGNLLSTEDENHFKPAIKLHSALAGLEGEIGSTAFNKWGFTLSAQAKTKSGAEADRLFKQSYQKYRKSVEIKPDYHGSFCNWGNVLSHQAMTKSDAEADRLFKQAYEKYRKSVEIKPDFHEAFNDWGNALLGQAKTKSDAEADQLFKQACQKYRKSVEIKPDFHDAFTNWGNALSDQAKTKSDAEADRLFKQSYQKYRKSVEIKPDFHEAFNNWGAALSDQAETKSDAEADRLFKQSYEKFRKSVEIKPDKYEAFHNWGNALSNQAETKNDAEADRLFKQAYEKYRKSVEIKPDFHKAFNNWGIALSVQAKTKSGVEADRLFKQAYEKYRKSVEIKPDYHDVFTNWGVALLDQARTKSDAEADRFFEQACQKYHKSVEIKPDKYEAFNNWGATLSNQAKTKSDAEADRLFEQAREKYQNALDLNPKYDSVLFNLACFEALRVGPLMAVEYLRQISMPPDKLRQMIESDTDFDSIRQTAPFQDFLKSISK